MGGSNATPAQNWATEKKTPQALGDAPLHENPELLKPYKDLLTTGKQNISLGEMIAPYYGGEQALQSEIEKAKAYSLEDHPEDKKWWQASNPPPDFEMKMNYEKIGEKIPVSSGEFVSSSYTPKDKSVTIQDPNTDLLKTAQILNWNKSTDQKTKDYFNKFIEINNYLQKDIEQGFENPLSSFIGTLEHEVGHHVTENKPIDSYYHMDKAGEISNQLGRIQREAFYLYGKRFTSDTFEDFLNQQKSVPEDERFQNFSPDTRRGLRRLLELKESPIEFQKYRATKKAIPEFVQAKPKSSYDAIENGLTNSEKQT